MLTRVNWTVFDCPVGPCISHCWGLFSVLQFDKIREGEKGSRRELEKEREGESKGNRKTPRQVCGCESSLAN